MALRRIYFCGSIRGGTSDTLLYARLIEQLRQHGTVLTEHVGNADLAEKEEKEFKDPFDRDCFIHDRDLKWLTNCDAVVAEVTQPSLGVGYELGRAVVMDKPILCLFRAGDAGKQLSAMIRGAQQSHPKLIVKDYYEVDVSELFEDFFASL